MIYPRGIVFNDSYNLEKVKAENLFRFNVPKHNNFVNNTLSDNEILQWTMTETLFEGRVMQGESIRKEAKVTPRKRRKPIKEKVTEKKLKRKHKRSSKIKKWMLKLMKRIKKKEKHQQFGIKNKYMIPLILGILVVKSLFILIALKAITFISAKGLMMGFFSTALASIVSLKSVIEHSHIYQNRMDDPKTQVEIIHVPAKNHEHYYDDHYKRRDSVRMLT